MMQVTKPALAKKDIIKQVEGRHRITLLSRFNHKFRKEVLQATSLMNKKKYKALVVSIKEINNKVSANEKTAFYTGFEWALSKPT